MGHVGAGRKQHEDHHPEQHQRRLADTARQSLAQWLQAQVLKKFGGDGEVRAGGHVGAVAAIGLRQRDPRAQAADGIDGDRAIAREPVFKRPQRR